MIQLGRIYFDELLKIHYVVTAYYPTSVPGTPIQCPAYEIIKVNEPDRKIYTNKETIRSWKLC